jgi:hypothetical protein
MMLLSIEMQRTIIMAKTLTSMRMFCVVAFPGSRVDGHGRYNMVSEPKVSTLSLDGPNEWSLDPRFQVEMVFVWNQFRTLECF